MKGNDGKMYLGKNIRIYPNKKQIAIINDYIEVARAVYNYFLKYAMDNKNYDYDCWKRELRSLIRKKTIPKIEKVDYVCLLKELECLTFAFTKFFQNTANHPCFKKNDDSKGSFKITNYKSDIYISNNKIIFPILGEMKFKTGYDLSNYKMFNATIKKSMFNHYEASILVEENVKFLKKTYKKVGIDMGVRKLITTSDGKTYVSLVDFDAIEEKIKKFRQQLQRKKENSNNYVKLRIKIEKLYKYRMNYLKDLLQKATTELVRNYDIIYMEDLDIKDLIKGQYVKTIRRNLLISSLGYIKELLMYKCRMYGKKLVLINRYYASSQICSVCGYRHNPGSLEVFSCPVCSTKIDRDYNAAKNILNYAKTKKVEDSPTNKNPNKFSRKL